MELHYADKFLHFPRQNISGHDSQIGQDIAAHVYIGGKPKSETNNEAPSQAIGNNGDQIFG